MSKLEKIVVELLFFFVLVTFWTRVHVVNHWIRDLEEPFDVNNVMQSVVHIGADAGGQGSGVYVGNGLILTAGHIVDYSYGFTVTFEDGTVCYSYEHYQEPTADVGFIYLEDYDGPSLQFDDEHTHRGDSVFVFGNPFGWNYRFSVTKGIISSVERDCDGYFGEKIMLQSDVVVYPGNSGGPVVDEEGEIVGILVGGTYGSDNISLIVPADICEQSMKIYLNILELERMK